METLRQSVPARLCKHGLGTPTILISGATFRSHCERDVLLLFFLPPSVFQRFHQLVLELDHQLDEDDDDASWCHEARPEPDQPQEPEETGGPRATLFCSEGSWLQLWTVYILARRQGLRGITTTAGTDTGSSPRHGGPTCR